MMTRSMVRVWALGGLLAFALIAAACAVSPTGRHQLKLFSAQNMAKMGDQSFQQQNTKQPTLTHGSSVNFVDCVAHNVTEVVKPPASGHWNVKVFKADDTVNAFAVPGGNIGVYTGLLGVTKNQAQLAAVLGHEIGHVEAGHANERLSETYATQTGLQLLQALGGASGVANSREITALLGAGAQVGVLLPFSRAQESEADLLGLKYMAEAGFDPRQSVTLWQEMSRQGGKKPPQFLSTHPSNENRIKQLQKHMPMAMTLYRQAKAAGKNPHCGKA